MVSGILSDVRIIDLTSGLAGPEATHLLAEQGADVIKVESPEGDIARGASGFATWNRSKRSVVLDLSSPDGRAQLDVLLAGADILTHDFTPSQAADLGLDDATMAQRFPRLIVAAVSGYPVASPDADRPAADILVQARSGVMDEVLGCRPGPVFLRYPVPSRAASYLLAAGIVVRLLVRDRTGSAGPVHTSLHQAMMAVLTLIWSTAETPSISLAEKLPLTKGGTGMGRTMFLCADDRWIHIGTFTGFTENPLVLETMAEMGLDPIIIESDGVVPTEDQWDIFRTVFRQRSRDEWLSAFNEGDVPAAAIEKFGSVFDDAQVAANGYCVDVEDPVWGRARQTLAPFTTDPASRVSRPAPALGEHTELLQSLPANREPAPAAEAGAKYPDKYPLQGLKVLDLGTYIAGPFGAMLLADLGADVIKVEPVRGENGRAWDVQFVGANRGKRSLAIDLRDPRSRPALEQLVKWADVVHHNMRYAAANRLGIDYESLAQINPRIVYCHVSSFGLHGPKADWPGYDAVGSAVSGWPLESTPPGTKPLWYRFGMWDMQTAIVSTLVTLLGLRRRSRSGEGSFVSCSMLGVAVESNNESMLLDDGTLAPYPKLDAGQTGLSVGYRIYQSAGGDWIAVAATDSASLDRLFATMGASDAPTLEAAFAQSHADATIAKLSAAMVACERVRFDGEEIYNSEYRHSPNHASYQHPVFGRIEQPGGYLDFGDLSNRCDTPPPLLGEHSREVLCQVGLPADEIDALIAKGVVADAVVQTPPYSVQTAPTPSLAN